MHAFDEHSKLVSEDQFVISIQHVDMSNWSKLGDVAAHMVIFITKNHEVLIKTGRKNEKLVASQLLLPLAWVHFLRSILISWWLPLMCLRYLQSHLRVIPVSSYEIHPMPESLYSLLRWSNFARVIQDRNVAPPNTVTSCHVCCANALLYFYIHIIYTITR